MKPAKGISKPDVGHLTDVKEAFKPIKVSKNILIAKPFPSLSRTAREAQQLGNAHTHTR